MRRASPVSPELSLQLLGLHKQALKTRSHVMCISCMHASLPVVWMPPCQLALLCKLAPKAPYIFQGQCSGLVMPLRLALVAL